MAQRFFKIAAIEGLTAEERTKQISSKLFELSRPPQIRDINDVSAYMFGWVTNDLNECVLLYNDEATIPLHQEMDIQPLVDLMINIPQEEEQQLIAYLNSNVGNRISLGVIIPSTINELTEEQMYEQRFFTIDEEENIW